MAKLIKIATIPIKLNNMEIPWYIKKRAISGVLGPAKVGMRAVRLCILGRMYSHPIHVKRVVSPTRLCMTRARFRVGC